MLHSKLLQYPLWLLIMSSLLLIFSFPPFYQGYLAWIGLVPFFIYLLKHTRTWKDSFLAGFLVGMVFFIYLHAYMALSVNFFFHPAVGYLVVIGAAAYSAFFTGLFAMLFRYFSTRPRNHLAPLFGASAWVLLEYLRSLGLLGHTGGYLGYSQVSYPFLLQAAAVYGYWGLPFMMVLFQAALTFLLLRALRSSHSFQISPKTTWAAVKERFPSISTHFFLFFLVLLLGVALPRFFSVEKEQETLEIMLVQGNIPQEHILNPDRAAENFQRYLDLSENAYREHGAADLLVWPETVFSSSVARRYPDAERTLSRLASALESPIFLGAMYRDPATGESYNSILLQKPGRDSWEAQRYDKVRLVPLAEYFPFPDLLNRLWNIRINLGLYSRGEDIQVFASNDFSFGGVICFESYFPQPALDTVRGGATHLFVLTNDAWFSESIGLDQHAAVAAVRAVETGVGVTQVANTGYTLSFDYTGRQVYRLPAWEAKTGLMTTDLARRTTLYRLWGDYFLWICLGFIFFSLLKQSRSGSS